MDDLAATGGGAAATAPGPVLALVGATATGKTAVGERLAGRLGAEVVCADSRQVFRELDVGTGKPAPAERDARPHHLFDALGLGDAPSAGWYARAAGQACAAIRARGRLPLLVGGSGLWVRAARQGLAPVPPTDPALRSRLLAECAAAGPAALHARLAAADPASAARLAPGDAQRIVRALEVLEGTGHPLSWWHARPGRPADEGRWVVIELRAEPRLLGHAIEARTRRMFAEGLVEETAALVARGLEPALRALAAVGYDEALDLLAGRATRAEAEARTSLRTRQLAKRQRTWFRHQVEAARIEAGGRGADEVAAEALRAFAAAEPDGARERPR